MFAILYSVVGILILATVSRAYSLYKNYREAQKIGLPIVVRWQSWQDPFWMLLGPFIKPILQSFGHYNDKLDLATLWWTFEDRNEIHAKLGPAFTHVTPFKLNVVVSDVRASTELMSQWKYWTKDETLYSIFTLFGQNLNTVNGRDWQRHRKITSYVFKEANNKLVWQSTLKQTTGMKKAWDEICMDASTAGVTIQHLRTDMGKLALHVLAYAAFGKTFEFDLGVTEPEPGHKLSYATALHEILEYVGPTLAVMVWMFMSWSSWLLPKSMQRLQLAVKEFKQYMVENVERERKELKDGHRPEDDHMNDNLLSSLVRANEAEMHADAKEDTKWFLTDEELYGNLFIFNTAGHETTAGVLGYAVPLLAIHQDIQSWCREEVDAVFGNGQDVTYEEAYNKLVRIRAVMSSGSDPKVLNIQGKQYAIPAHAFVSVNMNATHWDPKVWGADVDKFIPSRWIKESGPPGQDVFGGPPEGAEMMLWSFGPRVCPGKKFSQVEFVAATACLLSDRILKPAQKDGESLDAATRRLEEIILDSEHRLAMMPREPERAAFISVPRK